MATASHATMHQDHKQWLSDNDMWRCDISAWQEEFRKAAADLKQIEAAGHHMRFHHPAGSAHTLVVGGPWFCILL